MDKFHNGSQETTLRNTLQTFGLIFDSHLVSSVRPCSAGIDIVSGRAVGVYKMWVTPYSCCSSVDHNTEVIKIFCTRTIYSTTETIILIIVFWLRHLWGEYTSVTEVLDRLSCMLHEMRLVINTSNYN